MWKLVNNFTKICPFFFPDDLLLDYIDRHPPRGFPIPYLDESGWSPLFAGKTGGAIFLASIPVMQPSLLPGKRSMYRDKGECFGSILLSILPLDPLGRPSPPKR
jgi:hypothetical protein